MEFIHSLTDGRKAVIYDDGNNVMLLFITNIRNMQSAVIARDYLSLLDCMYFRNNLYIAYVSVGNELKWKQAGKDEGLVLMAGTGEAFDVSKLSQFILNEKLYVSYQFYNSSQEAYEIRYVNPNGDRKFRVLLSKKDKINDYKIINDNGEIYLKIKYTENEKYEFYRLTVDGHEEISLSKEYLVDEGEREKKNELYRHEIENLREELKKQHDEEINAMKENYTRQYNELSEMTRQVQEEGKKYRELYVQTLDVINRKKEEKTKNSVKEDSVAKKEKPDLSDEKDKKTEKEDIKTSVKNTAKRKTATKKESDKNYDVKKETEVKVIKADNAENAGK